MLIADVAILTVCRFNGQFNMFHVGAVANIACVDIDLWPMLVKPRPAQWRLRHYMWICWSYDGLWAAAPTELIVRTWLSRFIWSRGRSPCRGLHPHGSSRGTCPGC